MTVEELRTQFPHTEHTIYLNHAATSPLSVRVVDSVNAYLTQRSVTNIENYYDFLPVVEETRAYIARLLGADQKCVEFMPNTTTALHVLAHGIDWRPGDRIAIPACEFPANVYPFLDLNRRGVAVDFIPHREGVFAVNDIEQSLTPRTRLLSVSWVQFLSGFRADLAEISRLCRDRGVILSVDAIQGLGALQLDVEASGVDFLACGGQKWLMATQGTGFLYASEAMQEQLIPAAGWMHGPVDWDNFFEYKLQFHKDATKYRLGTLNDMGIAALHAALKLYFEAGAAWCEKQVLGNAGLLRQGLERLGMECYGSDAPESRSGIITAKHSDPEALFDYLKQHGIVASVRQRMIRFSPTYYNSSDEITAALDAIARFMETV